MGGSPPSAPVTVMPAPTAPTLYQSVVPLESYQYVADAMRRAEEKTAQARADRYSEVGTPTQIGARQAGRRANEAAAYLASLPKGDKYYSEVTGSTEPFKPLEEAASGYLSDAQKEYANALTRINEVPQEKAWETPSWAQSTIPEGMPGYKPPEPEPEPEPKATPKKKAAPAPATRKAGMFAGGQPVRNNFSGGVRGKF